QRIASVVADVTKADDAARLVEATVTTFGGIDILVNNVGGGGGGRTIADSSDEDWRSTLEINLLQTVRMMRLALPPMRGRAGAAVVIVSSISGWSAQLAGSGQYGAAKAALIFDTERWALEFVPHGVRVNAVSPGSILVAGNGWDRYRLANQVNYDDYVRHGLPMGRWGPPRRWPTSSLFWRHRAPIGSTAETYRSMGWSNPTHLWIGGHFSVWRAGRDPKHGLQSVAPPTARSPADRSRPTRRTMRASGTHNSNMRTPRTKKLSLTPQRSAIPPMSGGIAIQVSRRPV